MIEIPAGTFEANETGGLAVAKRELLEEARYISDDWQYIGAMVERFAKRTNYMYIYFTNRCRNVANQKLDAT